MYHRRSRLWNKFGFIPNNNISIYKNTQFIHSAHTFTLNQTSFTERLANSSSSPQHLLDLIYKQLKNPISSTNNWRTENATTSGLVQSNHLLEHWKYSVLALITALPHLLPHKHRNQNAPSQDSTVTSVSDVGSSINLMETSAHHQTRKNQTTTRNYTLKTAHGCRP